MLIMQQTTQNFAEKPKESYLFKKFPTFYGILNSITIFKGPQLAFRMKVNPVGAFRNTNK
jgi:hypothetical protein